MEWHWPKNLEELTRLLREEGALIHAGGTAIREERIKSAVHVIDMSCLPLNYVKKQDGVWHIGATAVLNDVIDVFEGAQVDHLLVKALKNTATTPLRNRITVGGSVFLSPLWSNLMGPLLALDAEVEVVGKLNGTHKYEDLLSKKAEFHGSAISEVKFSDKNIIHYFDRFVRTTTDYSAFTVTIALAVEKDVVDDAKIIVTGCKKIYERLNQAEAKVIGKKLKELTPGDIFENVNVEFADKPAGSGAYLTEVSKVFLCRGLEALGCAR